jgi:hypothetical protein
MSTAPLYTDSRRLGAAVRAVDRMRRKTVPTEQRVSPTIAGAGKRGRARAGRLWSRHGRGKRIQDGRFQGPSLNLKNCGNTGKMAKRRPETGPPTIPIKNAAVGRVERAGAGPVQFGADHTAVGASAHPPATAGNWELGAGIWGVGAGCMRLRPSGAEPISRRRVGAMSVYSRGCEVASGSRSLCFTTAPASEIMEGSQMH